ncbi:protein PLASTID MOVEMENT IMPAIRED 2 [Pistacia vera]|uniref:protein PLASTID MOVEMENT IMPAIRED 2 n=1 Tax=Pistacia vera TaxID=55513 RepID=UPI001263A629|nr:protein PLASTID MOVEMENT IMPAIRED 2 [Pistacia vera]
MDRRELDDKRRNGSVKAAINKYGGRFLDGTSSLKKPQMDSQEMSCSRTIELHKARRDISRYRESRRVAESVKAQAESELSVARNTVKELASRIEDTNSEAEAKMKDVDETLKKSGGSIDSYQYAEVMRELEAVKQEMSKLKLDMASVLEEKSRAEKEIETTSLKIWSNSSVETFRKEIEQVNEEQLLVELARIEALKEFGEIEAQREKEANEFSFAMEETKRKKKEMVEEIDQSKEVENKLAVTLRDVNMLQIELKHVKGMDKRAQRNDASKITETNFQELEGSPLLRSITEELEEAKKELASVRDEGFQFMASMDVIRNELKHVTEEMARLEKAEHKSDLIVQNLNSKLLRAKSKLEAVSAAEEKAKAIATNLSLTAEQLKTEAEAAKKEKELIIRETAAIKEEIQKTESEIDSTEEKLTAAMQELDAVKSSEALALENLKSLIENTMQSRASASQNSSSITISKFEYEYLTGHAVGAADLADKKVAAAQAWIEALKASEKEILMKIEMAHRKIRETRMDEEKEVFRTERSFSTKRKDEGEIRNWRQREEKTPETENLQPRLSRKSIKASGNLTQSRRAKYQKSASPATRMPRSTSFNVKRKTKVMPSFAKLFSGKNID